MRIFLFDGAKLRIFCGIFAKKCPPTCEFNKSFDNVLSFTTPKTPKKRPHQASSSLPLLKGIRLGLLPKEKYENNAEVKKFKKLNLFKIFLFNGAPCARIFIYYIIYIYIFI